MKKMVLSVIVLFISVIIMAVEASDYGNGGTMKRSHLRRGFL